jgi:hypothetical protein
LDQNTIKAPPAKEPITLSFSLPQIIGGALAAATAAAVGSQLGVAGTIIGASVASVIGGIAGTLYSAGLDRTHRRVAAALRRTSGQTQTAGVSEDPLFAEDASPGQPVETTPTLTAPWRPPSRRRLIERMVLSAAAIFLVAVTAITVVELGLGRTLTGVAGTSIGRLSPGGSTNATATAQPTATATKTVTATAQPTPTIEPTPDPRTPTATADPTTQPTAVTPQPVPSTS